VARWTPSYDEYSRYVIALAVYFALSAIHQANEGVLRVSGKGTFASATNDRSPPIPWKNTRSRAQNFVA